MSPCTTPTICNRSPREREGGKVNERDWSLPMPLLPGNREVKSLLDGHKVHLVEMAGRKCNSLRSWKKRRISHIHKWYYSKLPSRFMDYCTIIFNATSDFRKEWYWNFKIPNIQNDYAVLLICSVNWKGVAKQTWVWWGLIDSSLVVFAVTV